MQDQQKDEESQIRNGQSQVSADKKVQMKDEAQESTVKNQVKMEGEQKVKKEAKEEVQVESEDKVIKKEIRGVEWELR